MKRPGLAPVSTTVVFLLYLAFIGSAVTVLLLGVRAQTSISARTEHTFNERTVFAYISEKLRQSDGASKIYTGDFGGSIALFIEVPLEGATYTDILYFSDEHLCELFCEKGADFSLEDGIPLINTDKISFSEPDKGVIQIEASAPNGSVATMYISLRSGGVV